MATLWYYTNRQMGQTRANYNATTIYRWFQRNMKTWTKSAIAGMLGNFFLESTITPSVFERHVDNPCGYTKTKPSDIDSWSLEKFWEYMQQSTGTTKMGFGIAQWTSYRNFFDWAMLEFCVRTNTEQTASNYWDIMNKWDYYNENGNYSVYQNEPLSVVYKGVDMFELELFRLKFEFDNHRQWQKSAEYYITWQDYATNPNYDANYCARAWCKNYERPLAPNLDERGEKGDYYYNFLNTLPETNIILLAKKLPFWYNGRERSW